MTTDNAQGSVKATAKPAVAIVGCGKVGTSLARCLCRAGYPVAGVASRSLASARQCAETVGVERFTDQPEAITRLADLVLLTTPDDAIAGACQAICENQGFRPGTVVLHCSGALPSTLLATAQDAGASIGTMHPLQSFASREITGNPFQGVVISVEGGDRAVAAARAMAQDLEAVCVKIRTEAKTLYHASAVVASNYLVTVMGLAFDLLEGAGIPRGDLFPILSPLIRGTLANIEKQGIPEALTGPVARGDVETVTAHLEQIGALRPELLPLYQSLGRATVEVASAKGLDPDKARALARLLAPGPGSAH